MYGRNTNAELYVKVMARHLEDSGLEQHKFCLNGLCAYDIGHSPVPLEHPENAVYNGLEKELGLKLIRSPQTCVPLPIGLVDVGARIKTYSKDACSWPVADREGDNIYLFGAFHSGPFASRLAMTCSCRTLLKRTPSV